MSLLHSGTSHLPAGWPVDQTDAPTSPAMDAALAHATANGGRTWNRDGTAGGPRVTAGTIKALHRRGLVTTTVTLTRYARYGRHGNTGTAYQRDYVAELTDAGRAHPAATAVTAATT